MSSSTFDAVELSYLIQSGLKMIFISYLMKWSSLSLPSYIPKVCASCKPYEILRLAFKLTSPSSFILYFSKSWLSIKSERRGNASASGQTTSNLLVYNLQLPQIPMVAMVIMVARVTLIVGLPSRQSSFLIIFSQISPNFLKVPLKFTISSLPGLQVMDSTEYRQSCHLNLTFQITCEGQLSQLLRCLFKHYSV